MAWRLRSWLVSLALTRHPASLLLQTGRLLVAVAVQPPGKRHKSAGKRPKPGGDSLEKLHTRRKKQLLFPLSRSFWNWTNPTAVVMAMRSVSPIRGRQLHTFRGVCGFAVTTFQDKSVRAAAAHVCLISLLASTAIRASAA